MWAWGPRGQEVFAGTAGWSRAMERRGIPVNEPVEKFADPVRMTGERPEHDVLRPEVRARLLAEAAAPPGPDTANFWQWGTPCTTLSDWNLQNGGTRTFACPEGTPTAKEAVGNDLIDFTCETCEVLDANGKEFAVENTAPTGRYPKLWDLARVQTMRRRTGAMIVPMDMCAWGLGPREAMAREAAMSPEERAAWEASGAAERHKKSSWWLVSRRL